MSNDTTETPRTDALRHTDMWNTSGKLTESVKALIELCEYLERESAALRRKLEEMREALDNIIETRNVETRAKMTADIAIDSFSDPRIYTEYYAKTAAAAANAVHAAIEILSTDIKKEELK